MIMFVWGIAYIFMVAGGMIARGMGMKMAIEIKMKTMSHQFRVNRVGIASHSESGASV
jgi:hypothetical protein